MRTCSTWLGTLLLAVPLAASATGAEPAAPGADEKETVSGHEIFVREWVASDPRSHGGDGLGPVFNGSSCVTCHNQGGAGGAGGLDENVTLLSAAFPEIPAATDDTRLQVEQMQTQRKATLDRLAAQVHPDFALGDTVVIHRFGHGEGHRTWQQSVRSGQFVHQQLSLQPGVVGQPVPTPVSVFTQPSPVEVAQTLTFTGDVLASGFVEMAQVQVVNGFANTDSFPILGRIQNELNALKAEARGDAGSAFGFDNAAVRTSQRNTTALWGSGIVDRIPDKAIEALAERQRAADGRVSGRVHRLADGRIGRFGWKAQKATLHDFTMAACAVELGLNVPGEKQATVPYDREYEPAGLDLTKREVDALVDYIAELPAPRQLEPGHADVDARLSRGEELFSSVGCAECHAQQVGEVVGLYSDLLLHDLGPDLVSSGSYGVPSIQEPDPDDVPIAGAGKPRTVPPTSREWRTPPLWGVRDSAPYLHDGRAKTLEQAIAFHGGEADEARLRYMLLKEEERAQVVAFLKTLVAPDSVASAN